MSTINRSIQLPINECEEWIWDTLDSTKDCGFEYIKDGIREFLIVQMSTHNGYTQLWIYAAANKICYAKPASIGKKEAVPNAAVPPGV